MKYRLKKEMIGHDAGAIFEASGAYIFAQGNDAAYTYLPRERAQNKEWFEPVPDDPYQRFRDALKEGKRVFAITLAGIMYECKASYLDPSVLKHAPDRYFIEGVDIPMQPTQEWLDKEGVELTGECKVPDERDMFQSAYYPDISHSTTWLDVHKFGGRRWIVKKRGPKVWNHPASEHTGPIVEGDVFLLERDPFDRWWAGTGCCLCLSGKDRDRFVWRAAKEAK